jgi:hypothetical protein
MSDPLAAFVAMSAVLTGLTEAQLSQPPALAQTYYTAAHTGAGTALDDLLALYATESGKTSDPVVIGNALYGSAPATSFLARSIILEWYLGMWYDPGSLQAYAAAGGDPSKLITSVILPVTYQHGWVWSIAQAHPMGFQRALPYGYWNAPPPPASRIVTGSTR